MAKYPELEKLQSVKEESQKIGEFLEWLRGRYVFANWVGNKDEDTNDYMLEILLPDRKSIESILADYFGIDLVKVEKERIKILEKLQNG